MTGKPLSMSGNAVWNMGATAFSMLALFFLSPYLIRHLGEENYGVFLFLATLSGVLGLANLGVGEATLRYVALYASKRDDAGINRVFGASLFVAAVSGAIATLAAIVAAPWIIGLVKFSHLEASQAVLLLRLTAISFWIRLVGGPFLGVPQALLRYDLYSKILMGETLLRTVGSVAVIVLGWGLNGLAVLTLGMSLGMLITAMLVSRHLLRHLAFWQWPSRVGLREVFGYGMFAFASQLVGMAWQYADRILLGMFVSASAIAYFAVPQDLTFRLATLVAGAPAAALMPKFAGISDVHQLRRLYLQSTSVFLSISIVIFVPATVFIRDFLRLWISPEFAAQSGLIAVLLCASTMIRGAFLPHEALFRGIGRPHYYLVLITLSSLTVLVTDLLLIPKLGLVGAGYALCISPVWGIAAIVFAVTYILRDRSHKELICSLAVPACLGFACLGAGLWGRRFLPEHLGWTGLLLASGGLLAITAAILGLYELTLCREASYVFLRKLVSLFPRRFSSYGAPS